MSSSKQPHYTQFSKSPIAYRQYAPDDPVTDSVYDINMECDASLRYQNRAILLIDSSDRSPNEEPNKYTIKLGKMYKDVISIELKKAKIPNSEYILNEQNNNFYFQDSTTQESSNSYHTLELPIGNYPIDDPTEDSIRSLLEVGLNMVTAGNTYTVTVDPNTQLFTITQTAGSGVFNILFEEIKCNGSSSGSNQLPNNISSILGFKPINRTGSLSYTSQYTYNLRPLQYIILRVRELERIDSPHDPAQNAFCVLSLDTRANNFMLTNNCDDLDNEVYQKDFNPPLGKLDRLTIEITDCKGNPYNFRGNDHFLLFEIVSLSRFSNYHRHSTRKGPNPITQ